MLLCDYFFTVVTDHSQQLYNSCTYNSCTTAVQQLCNSCTFVQLYNSYTTAVQQLYNSCTTVQQLYNNCTTAIQQLYNSCTTVIFLFAATVYTNADISGFNWPTVRPYTSPSCPTGVYIGRCERWVHQHSIVRTGHHRSSSGNHGSSYSFDLKNCFHQNHHSLFLKMLS